MEMKKTLDPMLLMADTNLAMQQVIHLLALKENHLMWLLVREEQVAIILMEAMEEQMEE